MAITTLLDPALLPARTMDQDTFNAAMAYLMTNMPIWGMQTNALQANLNSIAYGGAYAMPYTFSSSASEVDPGSGKLGLSSTPQSSSIALRVNLTSSAGVDMTSLLNDFGASTSSVPGTVRLQKVGDTTKWLVFNVTSVVDYTGYKRINVTFRGGSSASPFVAGDALILSFQRTGDKGDQGVAGNSSNLILVGSYTVSTAVAAINFLSLFTSTYDKYIIEIQGMTASAAATLRMRMAQAGVSQANSVYIHQYSSSAGISTGNTSFQLTPANVATAANSALSCSIEVRNVNAASPSSITANGGAMSDTGSTFYPMDTYGLYAGSAACSGFTLFMSSGNITAGIVRVFGVKNT